MKVFFFFIFQWVCGIFTHHFSFLPYIRSSFTLRIYRYFRSANFIFGISVFKPNTDNVIVPYIQNANTCTNDNNCLSDSAFSCICGLWIALYYSSIRCVLYIILCVCIGSSTGCIKYTISIVGAHYFRSVSDTQTEKNMLLFFFHSSRRSFADSSISISHLPMQIEQTHSPSASNTLYI